MYQRRFQLSQLIASTALPFRVWVWCVQQNYTYPPVKEYDPLKDDVTFYRRQYWLCAVALYRHNMIPPYEDWLRFTESSQGIRWMQVRQPQICALFGNDRFDHVVASQMAALIGRRRFLNVPGKELAVTTFRRAGTSDHEAKVKWYPLDRACLAICLGFLSTLTPKQQQLVLISARQLLGTDLHLDVFFNGQTTADEVRQPMVPVVAQAVPSTSHTVAAYPRPPGISSSSSSSSSLSSAPSEMRRGRAEGELPLAAMQSLNSSEPPSLPLPENGMLVSPAFPPMSFNNTNTSSLSLSSEAPSPGFPSFPPDLQSEHSYLHSPMFNEASALASPPYNALMMHARPPSPPFPYGGAALFHASDAEDLHRPTTCPANPSGMDWGSSSSSHAARFGTASQLAQEHDFSQHTGLHALADEVDSSLLPHQPTHDSSTRLYGYEQHDQYYYMQQQEQQQQEDDTMHF